MIESSISHDVHNYYYYWILVSFRACAALAISVAANAIDYAAAPLFAIPILGDIPDAIITGILFAVTQSKRSTLLNMIEFVPVIGDFVPIYTLTTLMWVYRESRKKKKKQLTIMEQ